MATLTARYQQQLARARAHASTVVGQAWDDLGSYREADIAPFLDIAVPMVQGLQQHAASLTDAYFAARTGGELLGLDIDQLRYRAGPTLAEVYARPFVTVWTALSKGVAVQKAFDAGRARATSTAEMDVALATRDSASEWMASDDRIVGYVRVADPGACDFCLLASTQRYNSDELMPLHNACGCTPDPIMEDDHRAGAHVVDRDLLDKLDAKGVKVYGDGKVRTYGGSPEQAAMAVHEHGELGPVITNALDGFTSL